MGLSNKEWVQFFEEFIAALQPDHATRVSVDDKKAAFVRVTLDDVPGTSTSILIRKSSVVGESERQIRKVIAANLAGIGVQTTIPKEDEVKNIRATPNADGSMSPAEAEKLRSMLSNRTKLPVSQASHQVEPTTQEEAEAALSDEGVNLLERLGEETL